MTDSNLHHNHHPDYLRPSIPSDFLPPISPWITLGGVFLLGTVGTLLGAVALTPYTVMVKAPARIRPDGEIRIVQSAAGGKVKSIQVTSNQMLKQGDILVTIDDSELIIQKNQLQSSIEQDNIHLARTNAQIEALEQKIIAEKNKIYSTIAAAEAELSRQKRRYQDQKIITVAEVSEIEAALKLAQEEYNRYQQLANTGAISLLQLKEKEAALETAVARLRKVKAGLNPSRAEIEIAQKQIIQAKAIGKANLAHLTSEKEQLRQQKAEITNNIYRNQQELNRVETKLKDTIIRTPVGGTIQKLYLRNSNQVVQPGDILAQIAPNNKPLQIKAWVAPEDISKLAVGQKALMKVSACPYPDYGTLTGSVSAVSPDSVESQDRENNISTAGYEVTIRPQSLSLSSGTKKCAIQVGMEGRTEIITQEETVLTFMLRKARLLADL
ncbi:MAG: HlyD family efflux transporter periplasmic adaptor subunit [Xenococcaceae cyanobacterium MO_207.B15]|nr:HlyD family efflux transporter periplasmic adaptor subunit [Xenococcaceae cyanobacterium MO_207.B15]